MHNVFNANDDCIALSPDYEASNLEECNIILYIRASEFELVKKMSLILVKSC